MKNIMNKRTISFLIIIALCSFSCERIVSYVNGPPVDTGFMRTFGTDFYDYGWSVDETFDGGFIVTGSKEYRSDRTRDALMIKTDEDGFGVWEKSFGGSGNEELYAVKQTMDGGFISVGYTSSYGNVAQVYVVKTDFYGALLWDKILGGPNLDIAYEVIETSKGNYMIIGTSNSPGISHGNNDMYIIKLDSDGNFLWQKSYGVINHEVGYDIIELNDKGFLMVGYKDYYTVAGKDIYLIKIDSVGSKQWEKTFGSSGAYDEIGYSIHEAYPAGYLICSSTNSRGNGWYDPQIIKIDYDGNMVWSGIYSGSSRENTRWTSSPTFDGGAVIIGTTTYFQNEPGSDEDIFIIKIDQNGQQLWDKAFEGGESDWGWAVKETCINDLIIIGSTKSYGRGLYDIMLMKTDEFGHFDLDN